MSNDNPEQISELTKIRIALENVWPTPNFDEWNTTADATAYHAQEVAALLPVVARLRQEAVEQFAEKLKEAFIAEHATIAEKLVRPDQYKWNDDALCYRLIDQLLEEQRQ